MSNNIDKIIEQLTSIDKFIVCLMLANKICFWGKVPKFYKNEEDIRKMCPPKVRQLFNLKNLKRLGIVFEVSKSRRLFALEGFGIRVGMRLYETGEAKKVYELYGIDYVPLE